MATIISHGPWTRELIAGLSDQQLARLKYDELVEIVLVSDTPLRNLEHVRAMESDALVRLVHCVRQSCRGTATSNRAPLT